MKPTLILLAALCAPAADFRLGIIGTDTSHVPAFTKMLNDDASAPDHVAGARVVAAFKGGSKDIKSSILCFFAPMARIGPSRRAPRDESRAGPTFCGLPWLDRQPR